MNPIEPRKYRRARTEVTAETRKNLQRAPEQTEEMRLSGEVAGAEARPVVLNERLARIEERIPLHDAAARHYEKRHRQLSTIPSILTSFVGLSLFTAIQETIFKGVLAGLSFLATALTIVQTNLRPSEKAEKHRSIAARLQILRGEIQQVDLSNASAMKMLDEHYTNAIKDEPTIPENILKNMLKASGRQRIGEILTLSYRDR